MKKFLCCLWLAFLLTGAGHSHADIRVLFAFDQSGHSIYRKFNLQGKGPGGDKLTASPRQRTPLDGSRLAMSSQSRERLTEVKSGSIRLKWLGNDDRLLAVTDVPDPRVIRSPAHIDGSFIASTVLDSGAWTASGPDESVAVVVFFPNIPSLGLEARVWQASLESY